MYIAMNRFLVNEGHEETFEKTWRERKRFVQHVPGFLGFKLLRGETANGKTPFISHSTWAAHHYFSAWTASGAFKKAHADARTPKGTVAAHPDFSGYEVVLSE
ncbi:MAG: antibiotic biosynthesis monooxygenase family protein [Planctomycetota bacterium]|jgi:heme-degrading monooxygenase HmoA